MPSLSLKSPAKLNVFLKVLAKRPDGYHDLETVFERIDLCDEIRLTANKTGKIKILCDHPQVPAGPKNLAYKAALMLQKKFGVREGVVVKIHKRIPVAAGLAGGSSNAATTLLGLNKIWQLGLSQAHLVRLGAQIGSDVPFFLHQTSWALGQGRGDLISVFKVPGKFWHVVVVPRLKMYSKDVFSRLNLELTKRGADVNIFTLALKERPAKETGQLLYPPSSQNFRLGTSVDSAKGKKEEQRALPVGLHNDLETSILSIRPELLRVKERLLKYNFLGVAFSGSGPACYGLASSESQARAVAKDLRRTYRQVFAVRTL